VFGGIRGCLGCILFQKPLKLRWTVDECKPLGAGDAANADQMWESARAATAAVAAGAYTRPHFSSTKAVWVTPPYVPLSNILGEHVYHKMCLH
jgi:hypothetical protein